MSGLTRRMVLMLPLLVAIGCDNPAAPSQDSLSITVGQASGSTLTVPAQYPYNIPGGVVMPRGSGVLSVAVTMTVAHDIPWAQLNVYLPTNGATDQYCGQNLPDSPTWQFLKPGWRESVTVGGFQVFRLPCDVTGIRAILHMRNNGLLTPPNATETIVENSISKTLHLRQ